jgi:predicted signal transduction protein with EAL and GGDEF domain
MGHSYGDRVLIAIARRLEAIAQGRGFAARLGGDEFTVVHQGAPDPEAIYAFGTSIVRAFDTPLQVDDREVIVSVSVGASVFPDHEADAEALLRAADAALFRAKALGRSQLATFTPELLASASTRFRPNARRTRGTRRPRTGADRRRRRAPAGRRPRRRGRRRVAAIGCRPNARRCAR